MTETINRGPSVQLGPMMETTQTMAPQPYDGPGLDYQGSALPDVRWSPANKDGMAVARIPSFYASPYFALTDQIPSTHSTNTIVAAAHPTGAALTLVSVCAGGGAVNTTQSVQCAAIVPLIPYSAGGSFPNSGTPVSVLAIDFGFMVGTTTAGSATITAIPDVTPFYVGQWIVVGGGGNSGKTAALVTQVKAVTVTSAASSTQAGTITVSPVPTGSLTAAPIGSANFYGPFPAQGAATAVNPYYATGLGACLNPTESLARSLVYTASAGASATTCTVKGYDVYGQAMTETITWNGATAVYGNKAFKYVLSATNNASDTSNNYSIGVSDNFGIHMRSDKWEFTETFWNGAFFTGNSGWTAAAQQTATATTTDVRGTVQVSNIGPGSGYSGGSASNGSYRFAMFMSLSLFNATYATPVNTAPMFGVNQF